jgi:hypothetical protein
VVWIHPPDYQSKGLMNSWELIERAFEYPAAGIPKDESMIGLYSVR